MEDSRRFLTSYLLAYQLGIVSREKVLSLFVAWSKNKGLDSAQILSAPTDLHPQQINALHFLAQQLIQRQPDLVTASDDLCGFLDEEFRQRLIELGDAEISSLVQKSADRPEVSLLDTVPFVSYAIDSPSKKMGAMRFRIIRAHAKGGLGQISLANDTELNRQVAVKQIQPQFANFLEARERFLKEAKITGALQHPGIVPVYALGDDAEGQPYYAMRFIEGDSLSTAVEAFRKHKWDSERTRWIAFRKLLGRFVDVCQAIEYAHSRGILHRDIKPANIMVGPFGETLVVDWGLAKELSESLRPPNKMPALSGQCEGPRGEDTREGTVAGTPGYMSPEQASGSIAALSSASDIFSLGATLLFVLTGKSPRPGLLPFIPSDFRSVRKSVDVRVPDALLSICMKATAAVPSDRYASAAELAEEIEHWLSDESIVAGTESISERTLRWCRNHVEIAAMIAGTFALLVASLTWGQSNSFSLLGSVDKHLKVTQLVKETYNVETPDQLLSAASESLSTGDLESAEQAALIAFYKANIEQRMKAQKRGDKMEVRAIDQRLESLVSAIRLPKP